jgi:hypothetical protein
MEYPYIADVNVVPEPAALVVADTVAVGDASSDWADAPADPTQPASATVRARPPATRRAMGSSI